MSRIIIQNVGTGRELQVEILSAAGENGLAFLLGECGEVIRRFNLASGKNHLPLDRLQNGHYMLRIESANEVLAKQIQLDNTEITAS